MSAVTIRQLEILVQIVEIGSFRRCAEQIGISQVAISDHMQALESHLGIKLFDRKPGAAAKVTPAGERIYERALRILSELSALEWEFAPNRRGTIRQRITLATQGFVLRDLYGELDEFRAQNPHVDLVIRAEPLRLEDFRDLLAANAVDIALFMAVDDPGLFPSRFVSYEYLAAYVAPGHPLASKDLVTIAELQQYRAIRLGPNGHLRNAVDDAMRRAGMGDVETGLETDDYGLILNTLQKTECFACMLSGNPATPLPHHMMKMLPLARPLPPLQLREAISARAAQIQTVAALAQRIRQWQEAR